jgi:hypothetical protein
MDRGEVEISDAVAKDKDEEEKESGNATDLSLALPRARGTLLRSRPSCVGKNTEPKFSLRSPSSDEKGGGGEREREKETYWTGISIGGSSTRK